MQPLQVSSLIWLFLALIFFGGAFLFMETAPAYPVVNDPMLGAVGRTIVKERKEIQAPLTSPVVEW